jgi:carbamate kinase
VLVVAIGGNSLIKDPQHMSVPDQYRALGETSGTSPGSSRTAGRSPSATATGRRSASSCAARSWPRHELHEVPLDVCDADTQGAIGYELQQNLGHDFRRLKIDRQAVTVVTQVEVDPDDPAFEPDQADRHVHGRGAGQGSARSETAGSVREDAGRGWRRVVASPRPIRIVEERAIKALLREDFVVITVGGGGIPVVTDEHGDLRGVAAVIDKDFASALLATPCGPTSS